MFVTPGSTHDALVRRGRPRGCAAAARATISTPSSTGSAPPDRPEPAPRATHGTPAPRGRRARRPRPPRRCPGSTAARGRDRVLQQPVGLVGAQLVLVLCDDVLVADDARAARSTSGPSVTRRPSRQHRCRLQVDEHAHDAAAARCSIRRTLRNRSPSWPAMPTAAAPIARFCGEIILPSTPPERVRRGEQRRVESPASFAAVTCSAPNSEFDDVSEPVTATPSQPMIGDRKAKDAARAGDPQAERDRLAGQVHHVGQREHRGDGERRPLELVERRARTPRSARAGRDAQRRPSSAGRRSAAACRRRWQPVELVRERRGRLALGVEDVQARPVERRSSRRSARNVLDRPRSGRSRRRR